jgi:alginate O-acetyltransferase complex protein AlgI
MAINSIQYILFIIFVCFVYYLFPKNKRWIILLISSYIFYFLNSTKLIIFLILTTLSIYLMGLKFKKIDDDTAQNCINKEKELKKILKEKSKKTKKFYITLTLIFNFGILIALKYANFISGNVNSLLNIFHINFQFPLVSWILPLGISYYTLQATSYIIDVYRGKYLPEKNFFKLALFTSFFPQIVEGPIGRYNKLSSQLYAGKSFNSNNFRNGALLILWGYFKKMVIADRAALYVDTVFSNYANYSGLIIILAIILYTLQIYAEFSGCIDIVRGTSTILGIDLDENFKRPFFSKNVQEFWRRWHITLGTWLKDYVFYPVSFSKLGIKINNFCRIKIKSYIANVIPVAFSLFFVWFLNGLWHGASWKYICYGLYYYLIMIIGMIFKPVSDFIINKLKIKITSFAYHLFQIIRTTILVFIGMLIFRASNLSIAFSMLKSTIQKCNCNDILKLGWSISDIVVLGITFILLLIISILQEKGHVIREDISKKKIWIRWAIYYIAFFSILVFGIYGHGYNPGSFIYGQF